jgi:hypothetical protein
MKPFLEYLTPAGRAALEARALELQRPTVPGMDDSTLAILLYDMEAAGEIAADDPRLIAALAVMDSYGLLP